MRTAMGLRRRQVVSDGAKATPGHGFREDATDELGGVRVRREGTQPLTGRRFARFG
jgi:hypothetical protein